MTDIAVRLKEVCKAYTLHQSKKSGLFRKRSNKQLFWALNEISLEIPSGKSLGILGLNGSGKSTLLNIIAGKISATSGSVSVEGSVQLLDLGGGFNPNFTGRENIVEYSRSRGITRSEQGRRAAFVEDFADIGPFFDQPMKTYSNGMRARVAFGNAFATSPEILIVDESLAVGDAAFVNKCYRKIFEIRESGATFIYVSHSVESVLKLCDLGVVLHKGRIVKNGTIKEASEIYAEIIRPNIPNALVEELSSPSNEICIDNKAKNKPYLHTLGFHTDNIDRVSSCHLYNKHERIIGSGGAQILEIQVRVDGLPISSNRIEFNSQLEFDVKVYFENKIGNPNFGFTLNDHQGILFFGTNQDWRNVNLDPVEQGKFRVYRFSFPARLAVGDWFLNIAIADQLTVLQDRQAVLHFVVNSGNLSHSGRGWLDLDMDSVSLDDMNFEKFQPIEK